MKDFICAVLSPASWQCWPESWLTHLYDVRSCRELGVLVEAASIYLYLRLDIYAYLVLHKCKWHWNCWYIFLWIWQLLWTGNRSNRSKKHCIRLSVSLLLGVMTRWRPWVRYSSSCRSCTSSFIFSMPHAHAGETQFWKLLTILKEHFNDVILIILPSLAPVSAPPWPSICQVCILLWLQLSASWFFSKLTIL